jgi:hypothetical protein
MAQYTKPEATPYFDGKHRGTTSRGIGAAERNGPAGGEVRFEKFGNGPNSSHVTDGIGKYTPPKGRGV